MFKCISYYLNIPFSSTNFMQRRSRISIKNSDKKLALNRIILRTRNREKRRWGFTQDESLTREHTSSNRGAEEEAWQIFKTALQTRQFLHNFYVTGQAHRGHTLALSVHRASSSLRNPALIRK